MSGRLYKRGAVWQCWFYDPAGVQVRRSTKCTDKRAAESVLKDFERQARDPLYRAADTQALTIAHALDKLVNEGCNDLSHATRVMYFQKSGHLNRLLGARAVFLSKAEVASYISTRRNEEAHPETIRKELVTLRRALQMVEAPIECIPKFKTRYVPRDTYLTLGEFQSLICHLEPARQLWTTMAVLTGGRDSEIDATGWENIDWIGRTVLLPGTKTQKSRRRVPLHPVLAAVLFVEWERRGRPSAGVIVGEWKNVRRDLECACDHAFGVLIETRRATKRITPNDLRRTYASWLKQAGVDSFVVGQLLGHTTSRMVELVYGRIGQETLQNAVALLPGGARSDEDDRDNSVCPDAPLMSRMSHLTRRQASENVVSAVLGPGIEPGTRGFSVRSNSAAGYEKHFDFRIIRGGA